MLTAHLTPPAGEPIRIDTDAYLKLDAAGVRVGPSDEVVATWEGNGWQVGGETYTVLSVPLPTSIWLSGADWGSGCRRGPYSSVRVAGGTIQGYYGEACGLLAHLVPPRWYVYGTANYCDAVVIEPAPKSQTG